MKSLSFLSFILLFSICLNAQTDRWQQKCKYEMVIDLDVETHQFTGTQKLTYWNNSPESLDKVFYHLYFNAFQPGSMMDTRSLNIMDPDSRVGDRISKLQRNEIGYHNIMSLKMDGEAVKYEVVGTILEVKLNEPIKPGAKVVFDMEFQSQVPKQIRRSGRDSKEGISYSMTQWYPKMCEYDYQGWHPNPYVGREFHGIWGDFDVTIKIDRNYIVGGTGYPETKSVKGRASDKKTWRFVAPNVHDFAWGADPDYTYTEKEVGETMLKFYYQKNDKTEGPWSKLPEIMAEALVYINKKYGVYPYKQYSIIQGGDGGMEYPMCTLITGERPLGSLVGVSVHELMHSWYQMIMGTNEALYAWMDEGFTSYASADVMNHLKSKGLLPGDVEANPYAGTYAGYKNLTESGLEEPLATHADHFNTNFAYSLASYVKGSVFLHQLQYIIGKENFDKGMLDYYDNWKFKHPNPNDFIRIMEKRSGLELDWYKEYWVYTTKTVDYAVKEVKINEEKKKRTDITLERVGKMPMPMDVVVTMSDDSKIVYHIPLQIMRGEKPQENTEAGYKVLGDWAWTHPTYTFTVDTKMKKIKSIEIDPSLRMADVVRDNNKWVNTK